MKKAKRFRIIAMVPAKLGSTRLAMKNLAMLNGKPLIYYAIQASKESVVFDRVVVNAEDEIFNKIAKRYNVDFYHRSSEIVGPKTKTDTVVYDFILRNPCDIVAWVSPIAPFQTAKELRQIVNYFIKEKLDSLMTVKDEQVHCVYENKPLNFKIAEIFAQTQDLKPVRAFVYSTMMWRTKVFKRSFEKNGYALLCGKIGFFSVNKISSIIIKKKDDLALADHLMRTLNKKGSYRIKYDGIVKKLRKGVES